MNPAERYRILERTGEQKRRKFNDVFFVEEKATGEKAILKTLTKTTENGHLQERLRSEATFDFHCKGLPRTLDLYESETELLLVRSFQPGIPLNSFIKTIKNHRKPAFLLELLKGLAPLFEELASQQVVHLDIKPTNILVAGTAEQPEISLIDFGLSARTSEPNKRNTLFPLGYAAPELLLNRLKLIDQRTDRFALGIVLWQCFTGKLPLLHPHPGIMTNLQLTHPLPEDSAIATKYFTILKKMCHKHAFAKPPNQLPEEELDLLLVKAIENRYASLEAIIRDWEAALTGKSRFFFWK